MTRAGYRDPFKTLTGRQIAMLYAQIIKARTRERAENVIDENAAFAGGDRAKQLLKTLRE